MFYGHKKSILFIQFNDEICSARRLATGIAESMDVAKRNVSIVDFAIRKKLALSLSVHRRQAWL